KRDVAIGSDWLAQGGMPCQRKKGSVAVNSLPLPPSLPPHSSARHTFAPRARPAAFPSASWATGVPDANKPSEAIVREWAEKEKVEVSIDYITSQGDKNLVTIAAEAQAKSGHDILARPTWWPP